MSLQLRPSIKADLEYFYQHQADPAATYMAAFTAKDPKDKVAYLQKWERLLNQPDIHMQSILSAGKVVGCVVKFVMEGQAEITYAIDRKYWGQGIASWALQVFLNLETSRPITGRVAADNHGSQRVLEKAGFQRIGEELSFANARGKEILEYIYELH